MGRKGWVWVRKDGYMFRTVREDKIIDYLTKSFNAEYCVMPRDKGIWWMENGAAVMQSHLKRRSNATIRVGEASVRRRGMHGKVVETFLQGRSQHWSQRGAIKGKGKQNKERFLIAQTASSDQIQQALVKGASLDSATEWILSASWIEKEKTLDKTYSLAECEREQQTPSWGVLESSQACFLLYGDHTDRKVLVYQTQHTLSEEEGQFMSYGFNFIIATHKMSEVGLGTAWKAAEDMAVWVVPKSQLDSFRAQWTEDQKGRKLISMRASPGLMDPAPPDAGDSPGYEELFDSDSLDEGLMPSSDSDQVYHNSALTVYITTLLLENGTSNSVDTPEVSGIDAKIIEDQTAEEGLSVSPGSKVASSQDSTRDFIAPARELSLVHSAPSETPVNDAVYQPDLSPINGAGVEDPDIVLDGDMNQGRSGEPFHVQAAQPKKRPLEREDTVFIRMPEDNEPDMKRMKRSGGILREGLLQNEDTIQIRKQVVQEPSLKRMNTAPEKAVRQETGKKRMVGGFRLPSRRRTLVGIGEKWRQQRMERELEVLGQTKMVEQKKAVGGKVKAKRHHKRVGILEKAKQRRASQLTPEELAQRRRGMLHKVELDFEEEL
ncbi:hypothetical protein OIDMADRAFT_62046 [Oidiodendron maius Zn]|uniref:Uncharacterized protein n=1 Tax=Oidiodendron maius (strain Zn) TaxID=913774 RepID=A0A0C3C230_OIDMZ|nr:hypothetical protein OIDMADRAFT_62046 [Oidiodendron maius Zn]